MDFELKGKPAFVSGSSSGLGKATALKLAAFGTIDILANNCGAVLQIDNPDWSEVPPEEWARSYRVNFISALRLAPRDEGSGFGANRQHFEHGKHDC